MLCLGIVTGKIQSHFEFWKRVAFDIQGDLRGLREAGLGGVDDGAKVVCSEIHFIGEAEFRRGNSELIGGRHLLEDFVAARILHFKG